jgi:hypothetical protein
VKLNKGDRHATRVRAHSPHRAGPRAWHGVAWRGVTRRAVRSDGRTDRRDALWGGSNFLLLMTPYL